MLRFGLLGRFLGSKHLQTKGVWMYRDRFFEVGNNIETTPPKSVFLDQEDHSWEDDFMTRLEEMSKKARRFHLSGVDVSPQWSGPTKLLMESRNPGSTHQLR